jgi:soluble lytic murein transglycosylase
MKRGWFTAGVLFLLANGAAEASRIYSFVDGSGVIHFSDAPVDSRYRLFSSGSAPRGNRVSLLSIVSRVARLHGVDPALVRAVIKAESNFDPNAVSHLGAQGLMQLMPSTSLLLDVKDPFDPEENISGGVRHLKHLLERFDQKIIFVLAAYHAGERAVVRVGGVPPIEETRTYIERVLKFYRIYGGKELLPPADPVGEPSFSPRPESDPRSSLQKIDSTD